MTGATQQPDILSTNIPSNMSSLPITKTPSIQLQTLHRPTLSMQSRPKWHSDDDKFQTLCHRLAQLSYPHHLDPSSMELVQHLLSDLLQTTETARSLQNQLDLTTREVQATTDQIQPLRREISRLTNENNHLHLDLIRMADERDARAKRAADNIRKADSQTADLRFMSCQYQARVVEEQRKVEDARTKVESVFGRIGLTQSAKLGQGGGKSKGNETKTEKMFQRLQKIDIETGLEPLDTTTVAAFARPDPVIGDMVRLAEGQISALQESNKEMQSKNLDLENEIQITREQLAKREREIQRLGAQLEVSRSQQFGAPQNISTVPLSNTTKSTSQSSPARRGTSYTAGIVDIETAKDRIEQLEIQIEYLQEHIDTLEKELSQAGVERDVVQAAIINERDHLREDLKEEQEKTKGLMENLTQLERMVNELDVSRATTPAGKLGSQPVVKHLKQISELKDTLKTTQQKLDRTTSRLNTVIHERQKLSHQIESLKKNENNNHTNSGDKKLADTHEKTQSFKSKLPKASSSENENSKVSELELKLINLQAQLDQLTCVQDKLDTSQEKLDKLEKKLSDIQHDRADAVSKLSLVTEKLAHSEQFCSKILDDQRIVLDDLTNTKRERDDLLQALESFGSQVTELHDRIQAITADRDNMTQLYTQVNQEIQRLRAHKCNSVSTPRVPLIETQAAKSELQHGAESESPGDTKHEGNGPPSLAESTATKLQIAQLEAEIVKLQQDLEATVVRQKETGEAATETISQLKVEVSRLKSSLESSEQSKSLLESEMSSLQFKLTDLGNEKVTAVQDLEQMRVHVSRLEMDHEKDQFVIRDIKSKLSQTEATITSLNGQLEQLRLERVTTEKLLADQMKLIADIDQERDGFQSDLDKKAELIMTLTGQLHQIRNDAVKMTTELVDAREQLDTTLQNLNQQDRELNSLQRQLEQTGQERDYFQNMTQRHVDEARNLGSDLAAVTRENQVLNAELVEASTERDRYKADVTECDRQLRYLDELIRGKDQEKDQLMVSYRKLISEHERLDIAMQTASEEGNHVKMEVIMRDKRVQQLQKSMDEMSLQLNQYKIDLGAFEKQCNNMGRTLATSERTVKHLESERARLNRDIAAARDLTHTFERQSMEMQAQLQATTLENDRLMRTIERMNSESDALVSKMSAEKSKAERLEQIAANERTHKMQMERSLMDMHAAKGSQSEIVQHTNAQQLATIAMLTKEATQAQDEIKVLKSRVDSLESHLREQSAALAASEKDITFYKEMVMDLQKQVEEKKEQLREIVQLRQETAQIITSPLIQKSTDPFDQRVAQEILSAKIAQSKYEKQIARRAMQHEASELDRRLGESTLPTIIDPSISSVESSGNLSSLTRDTSDEADSLEADVLASAWKPSTNAFGAVIDSPRTSRNKTDEFTRTPTNNQSRINNIVLMDAATQLERQSRSS
ncbi:hypothetical protein BDV3_000368 [Batrachochytrium dendrobatidis]